MSKRNVLLLGGDQRQLYCAKELLKKGYEVSLFGFEKVLDIDKHFPVFQNLKVAVVLADVIILPVNYKSDKFINAPFGEQMIKVDDVLHYLDEPKLFICGKLSAALKAAFEQRQQSVLELLEDESFLLDNAQMTAEGAVFEVMKELPERLFKKKCLILGYGRIGKCLTSLLKGFEVDITVAARRKESLTEARLSGVRTIALKEASVTDYNIVFNTIPARVTEGSIENNGALFVNLANREDYGFSNVLLAGGVPGKYCPKTAGKIISDFILSYLSEVEYE